MLKKQILAEQVMRVSNIGKKYELMTEQDKHDTFVSVLLNLQMYLQTY